MYMHHCSIEEELVAHQLRKTRDRHEMLRLFEAPRTWSASQINRELTGDLSTVYRNLQTLVDQAILRTVHSYDGEAHYERTNRPHHDHLACAQCETLACIPCPVPTVGEHRLELLGLCSTCQ